MPKLKNYKLFIHDHINSRELSEIYLGEENQHGQLFILLESSKTKVDQQETINEIISQTSILFDTSHQKDPEILLEEILQKVNNLLPELSSELKIKSWINKLDIIIGIIYQNNVYLSRIGNINALLIHNNQYTPILETEAEVNPTKPFTDIISGQLDTGDTLIISTNSLFDYISKEKIKQIVSKYPPQTSISQIQKLLESVPDFVTFNSLIIKNTNAKDVIRDEEIESDSSKSDVIHPDYSRQKRKPKLVLDLKGLNNIGFIQKINKVISLFAYFFNIIAKIFIYIFNKIKAIILFIFSSKYRQGQEQLTLYKIKDKINNKYTWYYKLNKKQKVTLISLFIIILVLLTNLVFLTQEKAVKEINKEYTNALLEINNKLTEAEAKLIYNDEQAAELILLEIQDIINNLVITSEENQEEIDTIAETIKHKLNKVRHIYEVTDPTELFDLSTTILSSKQIVQKQGVFYILGDEKLYKLKEDSLEHLIDFPGGILLTDWPNKNKLILGNNEQYFIINLDNNELEAFDFTKSAGNTSIQDLNMYSDNLYVLDKDNNQIFKYPEYYDVFANGSAWISDEITLNNFNSFTIDGNVYIIDNEGKIHKFSKGSLEIFNYHELRPNIGPNSIIKTFKDSDYLYIIDPSNQRIVILNKDGNIEDQYTSDKFDNLIDLAIDPEEKAIYLLSGNHLYLLAVNE